MILYRCFAWRSDADATERDGALWVPREYQGDGRHDNPSHYGCLYLTHDAVSSIVEQLARFRTQRLVPGLLRRRRLPLALAELDLDDEARVVDLDDPAVLRRERLRPSLVATRDRGLTQPQALRLFERYAGSAGLRWWSTFEAQWSNVTLFDRAVPRLAVRAVRTLTLDDASVASAAEFLGMRVG